MGARHHTGLRRWRALRLVILARDHYRCRACGRAGRLEVDHILPLARGGDRWDPSGLQSLCRGCHVLKTAAENRRLPPDPDVTEWRSYLLDCGT